MFCHRDVSLVLILLLIPSTDTLISRRTTNGCPETLGESLSVSKLSYSANSLSDSSCVDKDNAKVLTQPNHSGEPLVNMDSSPQVSVKTEPYRASNSQDPLSDMLSLSIDEAEVISTPSMEPFLLSAFEAYGELDGLLPDYPSNSSQYSHSTSGLNSKRSPCKPCKVELVSSTCISQLTPHEFTPSSTSAFQVIQPRNVTLHNGKLCCLNYRIMVNFLYDSNCDVYEFRLCLYCYFCFLIYNL